jgi:hypothetical protein
MRRVEAMLRDNRKRVVIKSREGKVENSRGLVMERAVKRMIKAEVMLAERRISRMREGRGITMTIRIATTPTAMEMSLRSRLPIPFVFVCTILFSL